MKLRSSLCSPARYLRRAAGRLLASWAAPMELEQSAFVKRAQETARTADYTEVQIDE